MTVCFASNFSPCIVCPHPEIMGTWVNKKWYSVSEIQSVVLPGEVKIYSGVPIRRVRGRGEKERKREFGERGRRHGEWGGRGGG